MNENDVTALLEIIDKRIEERVPTQADKRFSGTVVSIGAGTVTVNLSTDPIGTNVVVQNPREFSLEAGDIVYINAINGNLTNSFVDLRKTYIGNTIYVDYNTGSDTTGNGSSTSPFATIQYAVNRISKNLNGRFMNIKFDTINSSSTEIITIDKFYGGGRLTIQPWSGTPRSFDGKIKIDKCFGTVISVISLNPNIIGDDCILIDTSQYVELSTLTINAIDTSNMGIRVSGASLVRVYNSTISNRDKAIYSAYISRVFSDTNSGTGNTYGLYTELGGEIVKNGTQPSGGTAELVLSGGLIR